jgi:hypothetical protein
MTSALRRKRQITVRSTPLATGLDRLDVNQFGRPYLPQSRSNNSRKWAATLPLAAIAIGTIISAWTQQAAAEQQSAVTKASYSTGQSGSKLQWLPHRPGKNYSGRTVTRTATSGYARQERVSRDDPFANRGGKVGSVSQLQNVSQPRRVAQLRDTGRKLPREPAARPPSALPPLGKLQSQPPIAELPIAEPPIAEPPVAETPVTETPVTELPFGETPGIDPLLTEPPVTKAPRDRFPIDDLPYGTETVQDLENKREVVDIDCPSPEDLDPIDKITTDISIEPGPEPKECSLGDLTFEPRNWAPSTFMWKASGLCHKPLYFEDVHLERYGHSHGPLLQPIISGGRFFLAIPALPYLMGLEPPAECLYTLGYYRPGDCAPYMLDPIPLSVRGALFQAGVVTGMAAIIP